MAKETVQENLNIPEKTDTPEPKKQTPKPKKQTAKSNFFWGTGRRKTSVARVRIRPGDGKLVVNKKKLEEYFPLEAHKNTIISPLKAIDGLKNFDVYVNVTGGGITGQAGATVLGIARALKNYDESLTSVLRDGGYLTRDPRMVERKKPGQSGARKRFQFSKR